MFQTACMLVLALQRCRAFFSSIKNPSNVIDPVVSKAKRSSRIAFLVAGITTAPWAALMPVVKQNTGIDESHFAILLLSFGGGALLGMPVAGLLSRLVNLKTLVSIITVLIFISMMVIASCKVNYYGMIGFILLWGCSIGIYDVLNNLHASEVENRTNSRLMSQFHALYTLGCVVTAVCLSLLMKSGLSSIATVIALIVVGCVLQITSIPNFIDVKLSSTQGVGEDHNYESSIVFLSKTQIFLCGIVCFVMYMCEGMIMDWGGVFVVQVHHVDVAIASILFIILESSIGIFRLCANFVVNIIGQRRLLCFGVLVASVSLFTIAQSKSVALILVCISILGIAIAAQVPMLLSFCASNSKNKATAISVVSTLGYAGVLFGPALLGYIASHYSLQSIFRTMSIMVLLTFFIIFRTYGNTQ